jgi:uncharacterized protein YbjT (DUF2867 family)
MNILVVGATGLLGGAIARRLRAGGHAVAGLVRSGSPKAAALRAEGVEIRTGDLRDSASLEAACKGVDGVASTATAVVSGGSGNSLAAVDGAGQAALVEAARRAGVRRFLFVSASPKLSASCPLIACKRATERALLSSGLDHLVVQPSSFMDIWLSPALGWDLEAGKARIFGAGTAPVSYIAVEDVAAYCAAVLVDPRVRNQVIPLGGPEALSPREAVAVMERVLGRTFKVTTLPGFVPSLAAAVLKPFNPKVASLMALAADGLTGDAIDPAPARALASLRFTPLAEWVGRSA